MDPMLPSNVPTVTLLLRAFIAMERFYRAVVEQRPSLLALIFEVEQSFQNIFHIYKYSWINYKAEIKQSSS